MSHAGAGTERGTRAAAPPSPRLEIALGTCSSAGAKPQNQDFHGALVPEGMDLASKGIALAIADGISTSHMGAEAAETAVKSFLTDYYATSDAWSVRTAAARVITATNSWMHARNARVRPREEGHDRERGALICTFSALVLKGRSAHVFHVGDARVARLAGGRIERLTEPHRIDLGGGESYLGRALGADRALELDYRQVPLQPDDLFMLSTDGVHEHLEDAEILRIVSGVEDLDAAARALVKAAVAAGSVDNLTVQLVRIDGLPAGDAGDLLGGDLSLPPAPRLAAGAAFEGYRIVRELHAGSRSHVYLAQDEASGQAVALKVPATEGAADPAALSALVMEEWVARRVSHPNLLPGFDPARARSHLFAVSPYLEGLRLDEWIRVHPQPRLAEVRSLIGQLAAGLQALHRREMLHRDLRPHNAIVDSQGNVRIIDFGSVQVAGLDEAAPQAARPAIFAGTVQYMAPELLRGEPASRRSDLFSLGVIAYQMLTGTLPYGTAAATARDRASQRRLQYRPAVAVNPDLPGWVDATLAKAVAVNPERRYGELSEFLFDLSHPGPHKTAGLRPLLQRGSTQQWRIAALVLAAALALSILRWPELG